MSNKLRGDSVECLEGMTANDDEIPLINGDNVKPKACALAPNNAEISRLSSNAQFTEIVEYLPGRMKDEKKRPSF